MRCSKCGKTFEEGCPGRHKQQVYVGRLANGKQGFFTGGFLVITLTDEEAANPGPVAERWDFELIQRQ